MLANKFQTMLSIPVISLGIMAMHPSTVTAQSNNGLQPSRICKFDSLSPDYKKIFRSRYERRVKQHGRVYADQWLNKMACNKNKRSTTGKNCRVVSIPATNMDGSMTIGLRQECD